MSRKKWHALRSEPTPHFNQPDNVASTYNVASSDNGAIIYNVAGTYNIAMTSVPNRKVVCQPRQRWFGVKKVPFQFLAVQNSSIGDLVTDSLTQSLSHFYFCHTKSNTRDLRPLSHLISVMRRHDI